MAGAAGLEIEVLDKAAIRKAKLGGLLGVARGSAQEPRFLTITHRPEGRPRGRVALVGKGVTFDSGGLSIKTATGMEWMKTDMAGAATVLGAMSLVPQVAPRLEVTAYLPLTDNMLGPDATRVGDVLRARNGTTIEVLNTDAEGRLILADALALAAEAEPDAIIDLATLTGACSSPWASAPPGSWATTTASASGSSTPPRPRARPCGRCPSPPTSARRSTARSPTSATSAPAPTAAP